MDENGEMKIEKSISEQIVERMYEKMKESEIFDDDTISKLKKIDLTNKNDVKKVISKKEDESDEVIES